MPRTAHPDFGLAFNGVLPHVEQTPVEQTPDCQQVHALPASIFEKSMRLDHRQALPPELLTKSLRLVVLGTSPSAGCGAMDAPPPQGPNGTEATLPNRRSTAQCSAGHSWVRRFHDAVVNAGHRIHGSVWAKNAVVAARFYQRCIGLRVALGTDVVIIELGPNMWSVTRADLVALVAAVRDAAGPSVLIAFLEWPLRDEAIDRGSQHDGHSVLAEAAAAAAVDVLDAMPLMEHIRPSHLPHQNRTNPRARIADDRSRFSYFYASSGADRAHPNRVGAELLGQLSARWLQRRLRDTMPAHVPALPSSSSSSRLGVTATPLPPLLPSRPPHRRRHQLPSDVTLRPKWEHCFESANQLPIASRRVGEWRIVDGGVSNGVSKGVAKLGLVSTQRGDEVVLGALPGPSAERLASLYGRPRNARRRPSRCAKLSVCLGYLLSAYATPPNGAFNVTCRGCECASWIDRYAFGFNPFPYVDTAAQRSANPHWRAANVSVTEETCVQLVWHPDQPCTLAVRNEGVPQGVPRGVPQGVPQGRTKRRKRSAQRLAQGTAQGRASVQDHAPNEERSRVELISLTLQAEPIHLVRLAHLWARPHDYRSAGGSRGERARRESRQARALAMAALECLPEGTAAQACHNLNETTPQRGYARQQARGFCAAAGERGLL